MTDTKHYQIIKKDHELKDLGLGGNFKGPFTEYINQKVPHPTQKNKQITIKTDYKLFLKSKKRKLVNCFDSDLRKFLILEWIKVKY